MDLSEVTPEQAKALDARLRPALGYLVRLTNRMQQRGWRASDPAYQAAWAARQLAALARDLRSHFNGVRVSGAGLETEDNPLKCLGWLELIEHEADGCVRTLDRMWPLMPDDAADSPS